MEITLCTVITGTISRIAFGTCQQSYLNQRILSSRHSIKVSVSRLIIFPFRLYRPFNPAYAISTRSFWSRFAIDKSSERKYLGADNNKVFVPHSWYNINKLMGSWKDYSLWMCILRVCWNNRVRIMEKRSFPCCLIRDSVGWCVLRRLLDIELLIEKRKSISKKNVHN